MDNNGWLDMSTCPIAEKPEDARYIIVWHIFQGAMVYSTLRAHENRFNAYWREPPTEWIDPYDRLPSKEDADNQSCILVIDRYSDLRMWGWSRVEKPSDVQKWAPCPAPPNNYHELRLSAD